MSSVLYATAYSLLPQTVAGNRSFFEILGVSAVVVCCLCAFILKEPQVSKSDVLEGEVAAVGH